MLNLIAALRIFYILTSVSVVAAGILLVSYQRQRQNLLLRSCCVVLFCMYVAILAGHFVEDNILSENNPLCEAQAIFLNYCYICIHAHACFMMLSNCYVAMGWKWRLFEQHVNRESLLTLVSFSFPLLYLGLFALLQIKSVDSIAVRAGPFFCSIVRPKFILTIAWFGLFSIPGSILAVYLLFKTWRARRRTLAFGSSTQLTFAYLCRLSLSTFVYIVLCYGSFIPMAVYYMLADYYRTWLGVETPDPPEIQIVDSGIRGFTRTIPMVLSFFPSVLGIAFFLMYGFGAHARAAYRHFTQRYIMCYAAKRRNSTLPLIEPTVSPSIKAMKIGSPDFIIEETEDSGIMDRIETGASSSTRRSI